VPTTDDLFKYLEGWSEDGRTIVFSVLNAETGRDLWILPLDGDRKPVPYLRGPANEFEGSISPDGRWLAYVSNETGQDEVYVQSFPEPGRKVRVSLDGGVGPAWADGGKELRYLDLVRRAIMRVPVTEGEGFEPGTPYKDGDMVRDVTGGAGFNDWNSLLVSIATNERPRDIRLILDWTALLEK